MRVRFHQGQRLPLFPPNENLMNIINMQIRMYVRTYVRMYALTYVHVHMYVVHEKTELNLHNTTPSHRRHARGPQCRLQKS